MSSNKDSITVSNLSKCYLIYETPTDRLKQFLFPRYDSLVKKDTRKFYKEFWALKNVSFSIKKGETVGIIGKNGSGKSTLLQMICGTLSPTAGSIEVQGRIAALLELGSGFNPEFTGRENIYMNAAILGITKKEIEAKFEDIVAFADIGDFIERPVKTYSSGMYVRLAFAVAVHVEPDILVIDEALSVGDELFQRKCFSKIENIRASGATILFVSHSASSIVELCDRAILIDSGEFLIDGAPKDVVNRYQKLLYAPAHEKTSIITEIKQQAQIQAIEPASEAYESAHEDLVETYDPALIPASAFEYVSRGALIQSPKIMTLDGTQVNGLVTGRKYRYNYKVQFNETAFNVRLGMLIKSTSGLELGGSVSTPTRDQSIRVVEAGTILSVDFTFDCHLNPGCIFSKCWCAWYD
jgi:lipopolysaccharide transport system ATP-binding protein